MARERKRARGTHCRRMQRRINSRAACAGRNNFLNAASSCGKRQRARNTGNKTLLSLVIICAGALESAARGRRGKIHQEESRAREREVAA